jgi:hypothetical protein
VNLLTDLKLKVWRQAGPDVDGYFETYAVDKVSDEASFLEMLDQLNERLIGEGKEAVVFDHDCREGICGTCSLMINGRAHGPQRATTTCQLHMRTFKSGDEIVIEPWRLGFSDYQRPDGGPFVVRPNCRSRRVYHRANRRRSRCEFDSRAKASCRCGDGFCGVHRLRCMCCCMSQWCGELVYWCQNFAP